MDDPLAGVTCQVAPMFMDKQHLTTKVDNLRKLGRHSG